MGGKHVLMMRCVTGRKSIACCRDRRLITHTTQFMQRHFFEQGIKAYCKQIHECTATDEQMLAKIESEYKNDKAMKDKMIDAWERKKFASKRYPTNDDSIGIEVVGAPKGDLYEKPTQEQNHSSQWLVRSLISTLKINRDRIFPHGLISPHKLPTEGGEVAY